MLFLYAIISGANTTVASGGTGGTTPPAPTCTASCGSWTYTYGAWSDWGTCSAGGTQTRTRTVTGSRTCTATDCSTYTETSSTTETGTQSCTPTTVWYCKTNTGSTFTSSTDQSSNVPCVSRTVCSTSGYPSTPLLIC
jgi:hypothetical protein